MARDDTPISDRLKQAVDDLEIEAHVQAAASTAEEAVLRGAEAASRFIADHRTGIESFIDRAGDFVDHRTDGRYAERVDRVRGELTAGVARLANRTWAEQSSPENPTDPPDPGQGPD